MPTPKEYLEQTRSYDAGRPNTAVAPKIDPKFKPAESAGMSMPDKPVAQRAAQAGGTPANLTKQQISAMWNTAGQVDPNQSTIYPAIGRAAMAVGNRVANDAVALGRDVVAGVEASKPIVKAGLRGSEWANADALKPGAGRQPVPVANASVVPTAAPQAPRAAIPALSPEQQELADVRSELGARNYRMDIDGLRAAEAGMNKPTPGQVRATILKKNGFGRNEVPTSARPGTTLSASPAAPRKPLPYNGVFAGGGAQAKAEDALLRKQMEVAAAERANPSLLYGPGSRDYISPYLTEDQQRARQAEIAEQRKQDVEDVAAQQVSNATVKMMDDQAKGITSDRNLAMMPYEQRRAVINDRRNLVALNADMQQKRLEEEGKAADRTAEMTRAEMEDSTTRRGQDMEVDAQGKRLSSEERRAAMEDATKRRNKDVDADIAGADRETQARSKALDREATLEAARIRKTVPVDRVKIENIKAYNKYLGERIALNPELQNDPAFLERAMSLYGLKPEDLQAQIYQSAGANPLDDDEEFYTP